MEQMTEKDKESHISHERLRYKNMMYFSNDTRFVACSETSLWYNPGSMQRQL